MIGRIGKDGTLYCETWESHHNLNYRVAMNLINDNCFGEQEKTSDIFYANRWFCVNGNINDVECSIDKGNQSGYKSYRCFKINPVAGESKLSLAQILIPSKSNVIPSDKNDHENIFYRKGDKFYLSVRLKNDEEKPLSSLCQLILGYYGSTPDSTMLGNVWLNNKTNGWELKSNIIELNKDITKDERMDLVVSAGTSSKPFYLSRFILINLTEAFGAGNEPTKEWCDKNIREQETYVNFGSSITKFNNYDNFKKLFTFNGFKSYKEIETIIDNEISPYRAPRGIVYSLVVGEDSGVEGSMTYKYDCELDPSINYYISSEAYVDGRDSLDYYWPIHLNKYVSHQESHRNRANP